MPDHNWLDPLPPRRRERDMGAAYGCLWAVLLGTVMWGVILMLIVWALR
jgi:hypothetical protein